MDYLTAKDIDALQNSRKKSFRYFVPFVLFAMALFNLVVGLLNLRLCARIAQRGGMDLSDIFKEWIGGVDISMSYSGIYLAAIERLSTSILQFGSIVVFIIFGITSIISNRRQQRIIQYIESKEDVV